MILNMNFAGTVTFPQIGKLHDYGRLYSLPISASMHFYTSRRNTSNRSIAPGKKRPLARNPANAAKTVDVADLDLEVLPGGIETPGRRERSATACS
jgi:hypothetical protein